MTRMQNELQQCRHCKLELPLSNFHSDKRTTNLVRTVCKSCRYIHRRLIHLSENQYKELLQAQNNECAICGTNADKFKSALNVDHNYKTGKIRGLLCTNCNMGLGQFKDSISNLHQALMYVARHDE